MAEAILYTLKIQGTQEELERLEQLNQRMADLKGEIKGLNETDKKAAESKKVQLKLEQEAYRDLQKQVVNNTKASNDGIKTLSGMRSQLANMNKELDNTKVGSKRFKELTVESKKLRDEIKGADEATGRFQGNVGDYKNQIINAFQSMGVDVGKFTKITQNLAPAMNTAKAATTGVSGAMKILKYALIATGIGAIVVVLGALAAAFFSTQEGADKLNKILIPIKTVFQRLIGLTQNLSKLIASVFSFDKDKINAALADFKDGFSGIGEEIRQANKDGARLAQIIIDIDNARIEQAKNEGRLTREMAEQKEIIEDLSKSDKERKAAGEKYLSLSKEIQGYQQGIVALELEQLELKAKQNDTSREEQLEIEQKRAEIDSIKAAALQKEQEIKNKISAIDKKHYDDNLKAIEAQRKAVQAAQDERLKGILLIAQTEMDEAIKKALFFIEETDKDNELALQQEEAFQSAKREIEENYRLSKLSSEELEQEKLRSLYINGLIEIDDFESRSAEISKKYADLKEQADIERKQSEIARMAASFGTLKGILGKESAAGKAFGIAQATINTWQGVTEELKSKSALPSPFGQIAKVVNIAVIIAAGLNAVGKIKSTNTPKFARGIIGLRGEGTETSDSIPARLSRGESVLTAKATKIYAPLLADLERSVGNVPNVQYGRGRFASGFIAGDITPRGNFLTDSEKITRQILKGITEIPVVVSETDITSTQNAVRQIKVKGDL